MTAGLRSRIDALVAERGAVAALDLVADELSSDPAARDDLDLLRALVRLRHDAGIEAVAAGTRPHTPAPPEPGAHGPLPEVTLDELDVATLAAAIASHGCLVVHGVIDDETIARLRDGVDATLAAYDARQTGDRDPADDGWFSPFRPRAGEYRIGGRSFMRESGGLWAVDSPRMLQTIAEVFEANGLRRVLTGYLGERPALSANKCNLRRVPLTTSTNWHQDGAFLGRDIASMNVWLALGDCGEDAPGLDVVPRRIDHLLDAGTQGAMFDWSIAPDRVEAAAGDVGVVRPRFRAGDALLFDHLFVHRTAISDEMTRERHAIESWFFAPSSYPEGQIPILL